MTKILFACCFETFSREPGPFFFTETLNRQGNNDKQYLYTNLIIFFNCCELDLDGCQECMKINMHCEVVAVVEHAFTSIHQQFEDLSRTVTIYFPIEQCKSNLLRNPSAKMAMDQLREVVMVEEDQGEDLHNLLETVPFYESLH
jgi:hypothetical protein